MLYNKSNKHPKLQAKKTKTYNCSEIRLIGYTILTSYFDTGRKYKANHRVWVTEEKTSNLLGVDFCHTFLKAL